MKELAFAFRGQWGRSGWFRAGMVLALLGLFISTASAFAWQMGLLEVDEMQPVNDLQIYLDASRRFIDRQDLYIPPRPDFGLYAYSPAFAFLFSPLAALPYELLLTLSVVLHLVAYLVLYGRWHILFRRHGMDRAADVLVRLAPLWLVFTGLLYEITYLNIYIFMALAATLLLEAILDERTGRAIFWLAILLPVKPQWAFALGVPFVLKRWRFFGRLALGGGLSYLAVMALTAAAAGEYAIRQYGEYVRFLGTIPSSFHWNTLNVEGHIGYNHSILQLVNFFTNEASGSIPLASALKGSLLLPLAVLASIALRQPVPGSDRRNALAWAFALYLAAFFLLDVMTELTLGIAVFSFLVGTSGAGRESRVAAFTFLPYAVSNLWNVVLGMLSFAVDVPWAVVDPGLFVPLIFIAQAGLYILCLARLAPSLASRNM